MGSYLTVCFRGQRAHTFALGTATVWDGAWLRESSVISVC